MSELDVKFIWSFKLAPDTIMVGGRIFAYTVEPRLSIVMGEGGDGYAKMMDYPFYFNNCTIDMINKVGSLLQ